MAELLGESYKCVKCGGRLRAGTEEDSRDRKTNGTRWTLFDGERRGLAICTDCGQTHSVTIKAFE